MAIENKQRPCKRSIHSAFNQHIC